jgi:hypothetical protein
MRRLLLVCVLAACGDTPPPACTTVDTACQPGYVPTFENVYNNTIRLGCGAMMSSCHSSVGGDSELSFADRQTAYDQLMQSGVVKAGDAACSEMIVRVHGVGEDYQMPPGEALPAPARCALVQWVQQGAMP